MHRRGFLRGTAVAGSIGVAGCLERLGFEEQSAWSNPPLVENRPDAVYLPAGSEEMKSYGRAGEGEYAVELSYTLPHRFWLVAGDTEQVDVDANDSMHLMLTVWDTETDTVLPVNTSLELLHDGESVDGQFTPWPMLSQRMGFHYGDNIQLPEEGTYTARIQVGPLTVDGRGGFETRFERATTLEIEFEFERSDIHDLEYDLIAEERRGSRDALPLMDHSDHGSHGDEHGDDHDHGGIASPESFGELGHPPTSAGPPIDSLPGERLGTERSADAELTALVSDVDRISDDNQYLVVCKRTPYNDCILPLAALSATISRDGTFVLENKPLRETIDHEFGHHYGLELDALEAGDEITIGVDSPPQVSRHDGYETAFFEFEEVTYSYEK
ncbi:iron transporter [Natronorubrum sulfidifaciens]|uniref:DUF7350 domain-containing protein n=1 Tax=Natronorubrum sulfidifaciens JCM 14089 TaxID=1230460 RepID=L9WJI1_9EURY|nr:iron transporter [Natronorubrum sulfidifaciens]ELY49614.1 hypothetical protein C495_00255 [Natronorubrum sulfidifaciens JCM 14089]